ncbi:MAG: PHP domain-containing protein [bacterium]
MHASYDLHTHSTASDGTLSPTALVEAAASAGVQYLALTDHDTLEGISEAVAAAHLRSLTVIPGVEISVTWNKRTIHMLGLGVDPEHQQLQAGLAGLRAFRDTRAQSIAKRLADHGIEGAYEGASGYANGGLISRTHFARFLVEKGHAKDVRQVFKRFLVNGKPGHVRGEWANLEEAITWVKEAGGVAVIAHPARYKLTGAKLRRLLTEFKAAGGQGLEVISGSHSVDECHRMAQFARDFSLLASVGSDFHSPDNSWNRELGNLADLPPGCRPVWEAWG